MIVFKDLHVSFLTTINWDTVLYRIQNRSGNTGYVKFALFALFSVRVRRYITNIGPVVRYRAGATAAYAPPFWVYWQFIFFKTMHYRPHVWFTNWSTLCIIQNILQRRQFKSVQLLFETFSKNLNINETTICFFLGDTPLYVPPALYVLFSVRVCYYVMSFATAVLLRLHFGGHWRLECHTYH